MLAVTSGLSAAIKNEEVSGTYAHMGLVVLVRCSHVPNVERHLETLG